jgi:hypothetical protein
MLNATVPVGKAAVTVARRALNSSPTTAFAAICGNWTINGQEENKMRANDKLTISDLKSVDGEYVLLVTTP